MHRRCSALILKGLNKYNDIFQHLGIYIVPYSHRFKGNWKADRCSDFWPGVAFFPHYFMIKTRSRQVVLIPKWSKRHGIPQKTTKVDYSRMSNQCLQSRDINVNTEAFTSRYETLMRLKNRKTRLDFARKHAKKIVFNQE